MSKNDIEFNYDLNPFIRSVGILEQKMHSITGAVGNIGKSVATGLAKGFQGLMMKAAGLFAAFKGVQGLLNSMPEVGQAFGIAKDVFTKNLLWPLRQEVMPLLMKMLAWVRDHRTMFVKWGVVIANVFRTVVVVAKELWKVFTGLIDVVGHSFQKALGSTFDTFDEFVNVLSFKVAAVTIYLGYLAGKLASELGPAFDWVIEMGTSVIDFFGQLVGLWGTANSEGNSFATVLENMKLIFGDLGIFITAAWEGLKEGFLPAVKDLMTPLTSITKSFHELLVELGLTDEDGVRGAFASIGGFLGGSVMTLFIGLDTVMQNLVGTIRAVKALMTGDLKGALEAVFGNLENNRQAFMSLGEVWMPAEAAAPTPSGKPKAKPTSVRDAIITRTGQVIQTDPSDTLIAMQRIVPGGGRGGGDTYYVTNSFQVTTTEGNARAAGVNLAAGFMDTFRARVSQARLAEGQ